MIQHKWFRIEQTSDGSILSCAEVEAKGRKGGTVRFYSAVDASAACALAKQWYERLRSRCAEADRANYQRKIDKGVCVGNLKGCTNIPREGRRYCAVCAYAKSCDNAARAKRRAQGDMTNLSRNPDGPMAVMASVSERNLRRQLKERELSGGEAAARHLRTLKKLDALGHVAFRAYLVSKIKPEAVAKYEASRWHPPMAEAAE